MFTLSSTPLSSLELMRGALRLFIVSFLRALPYGVVPTVLLFALAIFSYVVGDQDESGGSWALYAIVACLALCPALMAPLVYKIQGIAQERAVPAGEALRRGVRCFLPCLAGAILFMLAVGVGSVLFLLPGLYLFVCLSCWWIALVTDGESPLKAINASVRLVRGHWWHVAFGFAYVYPVAVCVNLFDVKMITMSNEIVAAVVGTVIAVVLVTLVPMFVSANMVVIYHDLKLRRQGGGAR